MNATRKPCKNCGDEAVIPNPHQVAEAIAAIPVSPSVRVPDETYEQRLDCCAACEYLREGVLCAWCGCFVQFRARLKNNFCPNPKGNLWEQNPADFKNSPPDDPFPKTEVLEKAPPDDLSFVFR